MATVRLDKQADGIAFDEAIKGTLPDGGDLMVITKSKGTKGEQPVVMLTFSVQLPDGSFERAQTVITARQYLAIGQAIMGCHPGLNEQLEPKLKPGSTLEGQHKGVGWTAIHLEHVYLVTTEGVEGFSIAHDEDEAKGVAEKVIDIGLENAGEGDGT